MKNWIDFPRIEGVASRQAHCDLPPGTFEREAGREGFFGPATHFYHAHPPTGWSDWEGPLRPQAFDTTKLNAVANSPWGATLLMHNASVQFRIWRADKAMRELARNGDGDELLFIHEGEGHLYCDHGHMTFRDGDYIMLPRATMWRIEPKGRATILLFEATNDAYQLPARGLVGEHAFFDPAMLETPRIDAEFKAQQGEAEWKVAMKRGGKLSTVTYPFNPLDAIGWKGNNVPVRINWRDFRPLMSARYHLPPSAHCTFVAGRFVICTFAPRPIESDPGALKVPFYHSNDDFDEVLFYHRGQFFSRDNIHPGMITFHPCGFPHGPHPKAFAAGAQFARKETDEVAVMLDTRDALEMAPASLSVEFAGYVKSWQAAKT
ncbi:MAG: homogentisate 1,2-dioxygenase [Alphaproteobacteria bacterium]|nr:homogentisate 1,2-dioxygenase [Alphaproteobacteria bacterium]